MDKLKESLARIQKWVKANPKKSAVIALVIVVIAYFAIKRGAGESGEGMSEGGEALDSLGGGLGTPESSGSDLSALGGGGDTSSSSDSGLSGGFDGGGVSESFDTSGFSGDFELPEDAGFFGGFSGSSVSELLSNPAQALSNNNKSANAIMKPSNTMPAIVSQPKQAAALSASVKPVQSTLQSTSYTPKPAVKTLPPVSQTPKSNVSAKPATASLGNSNQTAAQKAGLPKYFTGTSKGVIYVLGNITGYVQTKKPAQLAVKK